MKKHFLTVILFSICTSQILTSCKTHELNKNPCADIACTMMFGMINLKVTDSTGAILSLDDAYTIRLDNNDTIRNNQSVALDGSYVVLDDNYLPKMVNATYSFRFVGIKSGKQVVNEPFVIKADCCHIDKQSGASTTIAK